MISTAYCELMAEYNAWMNAKIYSLCTKLPQEQIYEPRGAYFKSIYLTLNHIAYGDMAFLSRFTNDPPQVPPLGVELFPDYPALAKERHRLDERIQRWATSLTTDWLAASLTYVSKVDGKSRTVPHWALVTHMFNHQTHHRGQLTTLFSQMGHDIGSTDIPFMACFTES